MSTAHPDRASRLTAEQYLAGAPEAFGDIEVVEGLVIYDMAQTELHSLEVSTVRDHIQLIVEVTSAPLDLRPALLTVRARRSTAWRIPAGMSRLYPMSSGRLGPASRAPSCPVRSTDASPPGPRPAGQASQGRAPRTTDR